MTIYCERFHKGLTGERVYWGTTFKRTLWVNYLLGKPITIPDWRIVMVLYGDWTFTRGHKIMAYVMYACFVWMHDMF